MKSSLSRVILLLLFILLPVFTQGFRNHSLSSHKLASSHEFQSTPTAQPTAEKTPTYDFIPLTALMQHAIETMPIEGASLLLIKDGQVIYEKTFGNYTLDTIAPIASGSKWLTAAAVMAVVDDGQLALDDPVARYLPEFHGLKENITVRQLLSHTSGLLPDPPCLSAPYVTLAQCVGQIATMDLLAKPGTQFHYGGASFQVAGRVAEVASGKPWPTLLEEKLLRPLDMAHTTYGNVPNPVLAGGVVCTLHDYGNFVNMLLNQGTFAGHRVLSSASVREMFRDQVRDIPIGFTIHPDKRHYGLGLWLDRVDSKGHALQVSSQGDTGFSPWIDLERNLAGVFLVNHNLDAVRGLVDQVQQQARDIVDAATSAP